MVVIKKKATVIPIDFGEFTLEFSKSDENLQKMEKLAEELTQKGEKIAADGAEDELEATKVILMDAFKGLFGDSAFDKVYAFSGQSTVNTLTYFLEICDGIQNEATTTEDKELLKKYLEG